MTLEECLNYHESDKSKKHGYHQLYESYFSQRKNDYIHLLEVGIFNGNSIQAWLDYFPNAIIYGIDIFERIRPEDISILKHPRVKWIEADSTSETVLDKIFSEWGMPSFDFIIDDGLHTPEGNMKTFSNLIYTLDSMGTYFIEDVFRLDIFDSAELAHPWILKNRKDLNIEKYKEFLSVLEEYDYEFYDNRESSGELDSVICRVNYK